MTNELEHARLNQAKWDKRAGSLDDKGWRREYLRQAQSRVLSLVDVRPDTNFLDIGCGTGWAVGEAAKSIDDKGLFFGVDLSAKMVEKAMDIFKNRPNMQFIQANAESIPLDDNFFDVIICTNSFHHYLNPHMALNEMYRLLRKGGKAYILDPTADSWYLKVIDRIAKLVEAEQVKWYSTEEFRRLYENAGLRYIATKPIKWNSKVHIGEK